MEGIRVRVKVTAGARKEMVAELKSGVFEVSVREKAQENAANERVCTLIARRYGVSTKKVHIISGHHRARKVLSVVL
jgi:uncharacterized protein YggU (UPF0235/DUF167 family)